MLRYIIGNRKAQNKTLKVGSKDKIILRKFFQWIIKKSGQKIWSPNFRTRLVFGKNGQSDEGFDLKKDSLEKSQPL